jgi:lipopolysaccharide transport system ATP-binding protein
MLPAPRSKPAIEVSGLSKHYVLQHESRHDNLRDTLHHTARKLWRRFRWGTGFETEEFWALRDVSFTIQPGEVVGIIGRNGAGKSTLLKILSRITEPTSGKITIRGRVASLLEVGTGFHPELSGRDNIYLNGAILGMRRAEIRKKFDEIVSFAEVEKFLDTPVKRYSSGMYVRLAFAVAAHLEPEILIVDEVLAVGDASFQKKCLGKMQSVARQEGRTILFVSHNTSAVQNLCSRALLLHQGKLLFDGGVADGLQRYLTADTASSGLSIHHQTAAEGGPVRCLALTVNGQPEDQLSLVDTLAPLIVEMLLETSANARVSLEVFLSDRFGNRIAFAAPGNDESLAYVHDINAGRHRLRARIFLPQLLRGIYELEFILVNPFVCKYLRFPSAVKLSVDSTGTTWGRIYEDGPVAAGHHLLAGTVSIEPPI